MLQELHIAVFSHQTHSRKRNRKKGYAYSPISSIPFGEAEKKSGRSNIMGEGRKAYLCMRGVACNGVVVVIEQVC